MDRMLLPTPPLPPPTKNIELVMGPSFCQSRFRSVAMNSLCVLFGALDGESASTPREGTAAAFAALGFSARAGALARGSDERRGALAAPLALVFLARCR